MAYLFTFGITLRELMARMENERNCRAIRVEISLFYFHPCLERTVAFVREGGKKYETKRNYNYNSHFVIRVLTRGVNVASFTRGVKNF